MRMTSATGRLELARPGVFGIGRLAMAFLMTVATAAVAAENRWLTDHEAALAAAAETGRPVLTVFTGSDWCQHCRTLERNVLETDTFRAWAEDRVILLMIDLPQEGISMAERKARSRVCIRYGVRSFPSIVLVGADGDAIASRSGYRGQSAASWVASLDGELPARSLADGSRVHSRLDEAVATARGSRRPILVMVSRPGDSGATTRLASLMKDPEFESLARENFVVAQLPPAGTLAGSPDDEAVDELLGGEELPPATVGIVVTDDGHTPLFSESGDKEPRRVVSGLRRFLASRQAARNAHR